MSHVTGEGVVSHMNESYNIYRGHVTSEGVMSHMEGLCHTQKRGTRHLGFVCFVLDFKGVY